MNTDLKGRIVKLENTSHLILHEDEDSPEWLRIKAVNPHRTVKRIRRDELIERLQASAVTWVPAAELAR